MAIYHVRRKYFCQCETFHEAIRLLVPLGRILNKQFSIIGNMKTAVETMVTLAEELQQVNTGKRKIQHFNGEGMAEEA